MNCCVFKNCVCKYMYSFDEYVVFLLHLTDWTVQGSPNSFRNGKIVWRRFPFFMTLFYLSVRMRTSV